MISPRRTPGSGCDRLPRQRHRSHQAVGDVEAELGVVEVAAGVQEEGVQHGGRGGEVRKQDLRHRDQRLAAGDVRRQGVARVCDLGMVGGNGRGLVAAAASQVDLDVAVGAALPLAGGVLPDAVGIAKTTFFPSKIPVLMACS